MNSITKCIALVMCMWFIYIPSFAQNFSQVNGFSIDELQNGDLDWVDYDQDGYMDFIMTGNDANGRHTILYRNKHNNKFEDISGTPFIAINESSVDWGDYNGDTYIDLAIMGLSNSGRVCKIYQKNSANIYIEATSIVLPGLSNGDVKWVDFDKDGDLDLSLIGTSNGNSTGASFYLYRNDGSTFIAVQNTIIGLSDASMEWADYDNDGDKDLAIMGEDTSGTKLLLYRNDVQGFVQASAFQGYGYRKGALCWGDYDNDGDFDLFAIGQTGTSNAANLFKNNGNGSFSNQSSVSISGLLDASAQWGDVDNDGDLDLLISGQNSGIDITKVYKNNGNNTFTDVLATGLSGVSNGGAYFTDINNDGTLDVLLLGYSSSGNIGKAYLNNPSTSNASPTSPTGLSATITTNSIQFIWNKASDLLSNTSSLSYNVNIYNHALSKHLPYGHANFTNGWRKVVNYGNVGLDTNYMIAAGAYTAGDTLTARVQAIDNSLQGSGFSNSYSLVVPFSIQVIRTDTLSNCPQSNTLQVQSNYGGNLANLSYQWSPSIGLSSDTVANPVASLIGNTLYTVSVSSTDGYSATDSFYVQLFPIPTASYSLPNNPQTGDTLLFSYTGNASIFASYNWNFDSANYVMSYNNNQLQKVVWNTSNTYSTSLQVSENGCTSNLNTQSTTVAPSISFGSSGNVCIDDSLLVNFTGIVNPTTIFNWNFGGASVLSGSGAGPYVLKWNTPGQKVLSLSVVENGNTSPTRYDTIYVYELPQISNLSAISMCLYDSTTLNPSVLSGQSPYQYAWSNGGNQNSIHVSPVTTTQFTLTVTDANGCSSQDSVQVDIKAPYEDEEICIVTIDSTLNKNVIAWEITPNVGTSYYIIYKESSVINQYDSIGSRDIDSLSYFIDTLSLPDVKSSRYAIACVDSCGNESLLSSTHKTMHLTINKGLGWSFNLIWTYYEGVQVQTYRIWRWHANTNWQKIDSVSGALNTYTDFPDTGLVYYFVEIIPPYPCDVSKAQTNYNTSRSNVQSNSIFVYDGINEISKADIQLRLIPNPTQADVDVQFNLAHSSQISYCLQSITGSVYLENDLGIISSGNKNIQLPLNSLELPSGIYMFILKVDGILYPYKLLVQ